MSESRIHYDEACPACVLEGFDHKLFLDYDTLQVQCERGHKFDELPSDTALRTGQPISTGTVASSTEESAVAPVVEPGIVNEEKPSQSEKSNTLENEVSPEESSAKLAEIASKLAAPPQVSPELFEKLSPALQRVVGVPKDSTNASVAEGQSVTLENGDLLLGVRIPESWRQAVEAEAEVQGKRPAVYLAEWLTSEEMRSAIVDFIQNYWASSYTQTV